jgi:uncharacterized protein
MPSYFFDSSATVKRYAIEIGSKWVFGILRPSAGNTIFVARITGAETVAALARKRKGKYLTADQAAKAISRFQRHFSRRFQKATITDNIVTTAMNYADKYELRGYDAVQLAAAITIEKELKAAGAPSLIFVSADSDLNNAAQAEGLAVENPNHYP